MKTKEEANNKVKKEKEFDKYDADFVSKLFIIKIN